MNKTLRGTVGALVVSAGLIASVALPASATTKFKVDAIMANDLKIKTTPSPTISTGGSSFDLNLVQAAINQFNVDNPKGTVMAPYQSHSSGVGRASMLSGAYNIGFSDFPLNQGGDCDLSGSPVAGAVTPCTTYTASGSVAQYVQVPVALGGEAMIYNLGTESKALKAGIKKYGFALNGKTVGEIWAGKITKWNDPLIQATNPKIKSLLPNLAISLVSRTSGSGTTFIFKDYLSKVDPTDFPTTSNTQAGCTTATEYPNSAQFCAATLTGANSAAVDSTVSATTGGIGYVEYSYAILNGNPTLNLVNASGKTVKLSSAAVLADATAGLKVIGKHFSTSTLKYFSINNEKGATNWPICGFSYAMIPLALTSSNSNQTSAIAEVKFLDMLAHQGGGTSPSTTFGQDLATDNGYVPTPVSMQAIARTLLLKVTYNGTKILNSTD